MAESRQDPIASEAWDAIRGILYNLYVEENKTLKETIQILKTYHDFPASATERMFKTRIQKWGFDLKTIRHDLWAQMYQIYISRMAQTGKETVFDVSVAGEIKTIRFSDIKKHYKRIDPERQTTLDEQRLAELIQRSQLSFHTPSNSPQVRPTARDNLPGGDVPPTSHESSPGPTAPPDGARRLLHADEMPLQTGFDFLGQAFHQPVPVHYAETQVRRPSPWAGLPYNTYAQAGCSSRLPPMLCPPTPRDDRRRAVNRRSSGTPPSRASSEENVQDLTLLFSRQLNLDTGCDEATRRRFQRYTGYESVERSPEPENGFDESEYLAGQWGYHNMLWCIHQKDNPTLATWHQESAARMFRAMLVRATKFVLPGLNWMTSNLVAISHSTYRSFLEESIAIIDSVQGHNLVYGLLYKYASAVFENDHGEIERLGALFERSQQQCRQIFGSESMNMLVFDFYYVWHLLEKHQYGAAFDKIRLLLDKSERIAGRNDLLTINCLAITSRAYSEVNQYDDAILFIEDAVERSKVKFAIENPFRLKLIHNRALLLKKISRFSMAETLLHEVLRGRIMVLGISNTFVWGSMEELRTLLIEQGRPEEAQRLREEMEELFYQDDLSSKLHNLGIRHDLTWNAIETLCDRFRKSGRENEAVQLRSNMLDMWNRAQQQQ